METNRKKSEHEKETTLNPPEQQQKQQNKKKFSEKSKKRKENESDYPEPVFWIGGKTDPDRFSTPTETEKPFFFRIGFHDDERSDTASPIPFTNRDYYFSDRSAFFDAQRRILMERIGVTASTSEILKVPRPIPMTPSSSASSLRTTLSPVREVASNTHFETIENSAKKLCAHECSHSSSFIRVRHNIITKWYLSNKQKKFEFTCF